MPSIPRMPGSAPAAPNARVPPADGLVSLPAWMRGARATLGLVPRRLPGATRCGVLWEAESGRFLLTVPEVARYLATEGRSLTIDPDPDADPADVSRFALTTPLAALCLERGLPVLHAAALIGPSGAAVICGDSAAGKSTLAAALALRGWTLIADDLAPIALDDDFAPIVQPTGSRIALWPDAVEALGVDITHATDPEGFPARWAPEFVALAPTPVTAVWWLRLDSVPALESRDLKGAERLEAISAMAYNSHIAAALLDPAAHLRIAGALARTTVMRRVRRPRSRWSVEELADLIEAG